LHTSFGIALLVKVALVCVLVALGAVNHFATVPGLGRDPEAVRPLRRTVGGEIVLGVAVLAVTGLLSGYAPAPRAVATAQAPARNASAAAQASARSAVGAAAVTRAAGAHAAAASAPQARVVVLRRPAS
jgi:copper transport protein